MRRDARRPCFHVSYRFGRRHRRKASRVQLGTSKAAVASRLSFYLCCLDHNSRARISIQRCQSLAEHKETNATGALYPDTPTSTPRAPNRRTKLRAATHPNARARALLVNIADVDVDLDPSTPSIAIGITYDTACRRQVVRSDTATRRARQRATRREVTLFKRMLGSSWEARGEGYPG